MRAFASTLRPALSATVLIAFHLYPPALAASAPTLDQVLGYSYVSGFFNLMT